jgi:hypothetical protein
MVGAAMKPVANRLDLAGVLGLIAPLAVTLGLFKATGSIGRIQRDDPYLLWLAITLVLLAGTMLAIAAFLSGEGESEKGKWWEKRLFFGAALCAAVGFVIALGLVFSNAGNESRPAISATLSPDQSKLTVHVTASNLKTDHRLALKIDLAIMKLDKTLDSVNPFEKYAYLPLERIYEGPDSDGNVDQRIEMGIPTGRSYTHLVVKAYTNPANQSCGEPAGEMDAGTACTIFYLDPNRKLSRSSSPR